MKDNEKRKTQEKRLKRKIENKDSQKSANWQDADMEVTGIIIIMIQTEIHWREKKATQVIRNMYRK